MNKEKVFIEGYEVGSLVDTTGAREKKIQGREIHLQIN